MSCCPECGYDWDSAPSEAIAMVRALPARLSRLLQTANIDNDDPRLRTRPAATAWSPLEYIAHTGDAIEWYSRRVDRVLAERRPTFDAFDWNTHTASQRYHERRLDDVVRAVSGVCGKCTSTIGALDADQWEEAGTGSDGQPRTIAQLVRRAAHEAQHHLRDIQLGISPE